jgi:hypothetical protein
MLTRIAIATITISIACAITVVIPIAIMVGYTMLAIRMAAKFLDLPRRHITVAPAFFLSFVPPRRACLAAIAVLIAFAVTVAVSIGVVAIIIAIMGFNFVLVLVLFVAAAMAITMASLGMGAGRQGHAKDQRQQKLKEFGCHWGTLLPGKWQILCHSGWLSSYQGECYLSS